MSFILLSVKVRAFEVVVDDFKGFHIFGVTQLEGNQTSVYPCRILVFYW